VDDELIVIDAARSRAEWSRGAWWLSRQHGQADGEAEKTQACENDKVAICNETHRPLAPGFFLHPWWVGGSNKRSSKLMWS
jgi:hypothetical protein